MRTLGSNGRWGNQLTQRAFIKAYAQENQAAWGVTPWVGKYLFGLDDPGVTEILPTFQERCHDGDVHRPIAPEPGEAIGYDYHGWCQFPTAWWAERHGRRGVWRDYVPAAEWLERLKPITEFAHDGSTVIGVQIRRGDYGQGTPYDAITPVDWYLDCLQKIWHCVRFPKLFVATEDRDLVEVFAEYKPETVESLGVELKPEPYPFYNYLIEDVQSGKPHLLDWFPEWYGLNQCQVLLAANSTFPLTAAMAATASNGNGSVSFWRPSQEKQAFVQEKVWDCLPLRLDCPRKA